MGSFKTRLTVTMALLLGGCVGFVQLYFPSYFRAQAEASFAEQAQGLGRLTGSTLGPVLDFEDHAAADARLAELTAVAAADAAVLYDASGQVFGRWSRTERLHLALSPIPPAGFNAARDHFITRVPIAGKDVGGGELVLLLNTADLARQNAESERVVLVASAVLLVLGLAAALLLGWLLMRPIGRVTAAARRISAGDVTAHEQLDLGRHDEVGVMARALRDMVSRLIEQRALLESQSEASSEGILVADRQGKVLAHNRRFRELWSFGTEELARLPLGEVLTRLRAASQTRLPLLENAEDFSLGTVEPFKLTDGRVLTAYRAPILAEGGTPFAVAWYFRDVTELKRAQEQLVLADRRSSVGRLAAGVAHEVNNPLTFIIGNVGYCVERLEELAEPKELVQSVIEALTDIKTGAERVAYIVRSLTSLSRGDDGERSQVDLVECLRRTMTIASPELKHRAQVVSKFELVSATVDANPVRMGQVFLNLLINAAKALPEGDDNTVEVTTRAGPDSTIEVAIRDTGCGMSDEVLARLFTPFFTTREAGSGTGLGLSISLSIVQSYGGTISVKSAPGKGSTFTVRLPMSSGQTVRVSAPEVVEAPLRKLKLLVVDDDPQVARSVWRTLGQDHHVTVVQSAPDALALLERGEKFDVLLTDLHMPGMTGPELYLSLSRLDPALAINTLFMTGGGVTDDIRQFIASHEPQLFHKPLDTNQLKRALSQFTREGRFHA